MKILLAHGYFLAGDLNEQKVMKPYPPLGILHISAALKGEGHEVEVFDSTFLAPADFEAQLARFAPQLVGLYANVISRENVLGLLKRARELGYPVVVGGPDATGDGEAYLAAGALAAVRGEGERTAIELVARLEEHGMDAGLRSIKGLLIPGDEGCCDTGERERIGDLDALPLPDRGAIPMQRYLDAWRARHGYTSVSLITSRGCPYRCTWCSREIFGNSVRQRSPEKVVDEVEMLLREYRPDQLWFADDVLTLNRKWILELTRLMKERGLATRFECLSRVDRVDEEILDGLKEAGCFRIWYGAESGSEKMVKAMNKGFTVERIRESVKLTMSKGIEAGLFILMGYPGENLLDLAKTLRMIRELRPDYCGGSVAFPIKGTVFHEEVKHLLAEDYAWSRRNENRLSFKGRYPRMFYWFAVRLLHNWASFFSVRSRRLPWTRRLLHALKFSVAGAGTACIGLVYGVLQWIVPGRGGAS